MACFIFSHVSITANISSFLSPLQDNRGDSDDIGENHGHSHFMVRIAFHRLCLRLASYFTPTFLQVSDVQRAETGIHHLPVAPENQG